MAGSDRAFHFHPTQLMILGSHNQISNFVSFLAINNLRFEFPSNPNLTTVALEILDTNQTHISLLDQGSHAILSLPGSESLNMIPQIDSHMTATNSSKLYFICGHSTNTSSPVLHFPMKQEPVSHDIVSILSAAHESRRSPFLRRLPVSDTS